MKSIYKKYGEFYKNNLKLLLFNLVLVAVVFGCRIFAHAISVDTDKVICNPYSDIDWLVIGRWGLVLIRSIFQTRWFNPYISGVLCYFTIIVFLMTFSFVFSYISEKKMNYFIFCGLFITHPFFAFQWFFKLQEFEIAFSILLIALALLAVFYWLKENNIIALVVGLFLMCWSFSCYETNIILYIAGALIGYLLLKQTYSKKESQIICVKLIVSFLGAVAFLLLIMSLFFNNEVEKEYSILWGTVSAAQCLLNIAKSIGVMIIGYRMFNVAFSCLIIGSFLIFIAMVKKKIKINWFRIVVFLALLAVPFAEVIVTGNTLVYRSQYVLPFVIGGGAMYLLSFCEKEQIAPKCARIIVYVLATVFVVQQCQATLRLWYTDDVRYDQDCRKLQSLLESINDEGIDYSDKSIIFYGKWEAPLNGACYSKIEMFGFSYFDMYTEYPPNYFWSSDNLQKLATINGYDYLQPKEEQAIEAQTLVKEMPEWPEKGCIQDEGDYVIVNLGNREGINSGERK
ncbi:MAG: glucosyltransferase domain-containing protein [Hespellia sp.]|nr:glucosyltransferase domain-containing protein [Hespellia sp.]